MIDPDTIAVYEARAEEWRDQRPPVGRARAEAFGRDAAAANGGPVLDLGCGPGPYTTAFGETAIALDAAAEMLRLVGEVAQNARRVRADLTRLPFARQSIGSVWARCSYVHVPRPATPLALHDLHRSVMVGGLIDLTLIEGDTDFGVHEADDFPGRHFSGWTEDLLRTVVIGAGFELNDLQRPETKYASLTVRATRARSLADTVGPGMRLLLCGLNPSEYAADVGVGFARPGNRFWPAALAAGIVTRDRDPRDALTTHGVGMTDLVKRATPRADALHRDEYRAGLARIDRMVSWLRPRAVCFVGLAGWRAATDRKAVAGVQERTIGDRPVYVMPNPSGLNAHSTVDDLADHLRAARRLADSAP